MRACKASAILHRPGCQPFSAEPGNPRATALPRAHELHHSAGRDRSGIPFAPLTLAPGPVLLYKQPLNIAAGAQRLGINVTSRADEFLFEHVSLAQGVTLADVFGLLKRCPALQRVFRVEDALGRAAAPCSPLPGTGDAENVQARLEYLELSWDWGMDTSVGRFSSVHQLDLEGVGPVLQADAPALRRRKGERVRWSVSFAPFQELLDLPLLFNEVLTVSEDDPDAKAYGDVLGRGLCNEVTLGQVIHSVLSELDLKSGSGVRLQVEVDPASSSAEIMPSPAGPAAPTEPAGGGPATDAELPEGWTAEQLEEHELLHGVGHATWAIRKGMPLTVGSLRELLDHFNPDLPVASWNGTSLCSMISTDVRVMRDRESGGYEHLLFCTLEPGQEVAPDIELDP